MDFVYDPFDAEVMANPLPYYRILRDHLVYCMPQWDTFALSRFDDIWRVLEVNNGTFVASEGTLPPASVLAQHNDARSTTRRCTRCRFTPCSTPTSTARSGAPARARSGRGRSPTSRAGSGPWPTNAWTSCWRAAPST